MTLRAWGGHNKIHLAPGQRIGGWTVIGAAPPLRRAGKVVTLWRCRCECGAVRLVRAESLLHGRTTRCASCAQRARRVRERVGTEK